MDLDLWGSSYHQVAQENSYSTLPGWECDFYIGYGYDVIEEDALNEKSCIQVLKILITKADTEIDELEQDLVSLQSQLAWAEHEEWPELCCNALTEKINCLDISIRNLRNTDENDIEVQLLMHREPVERVHEIVRALLRNYIQEKDEQPLDAFSLDSSSNVPKHAVSLLDENEMSSNIDSSISIKEETKESSITGKCTGSNLSLKLQEKKSNDTETVKPKDSTIENSSEDALLHAIDHYNKKKKLSGPNLKIMGEEIEEHESTPTVDDIILGSSSNSEGKRRDHGQEVKPLDAIALDSRSNVPKHAASLLDENEMSSDIDSSISFKKGPKESSITGKCLALQEKKSNYPETIKPKDSTIENSSEDALLHAIDHYNKKKKLSGPNLKIMGEEIEEHESTPTVDDIILGSSSNSERERRDHGQEVKPLDAIALDSRSSVPKHAASLLDENEMSSDIDSSISFKEGTKESSTTGKCSGSNLSLALQEKKSNYPETIKPEDGTIKNSSKDAFLHTIDHSNKKKLSCPNMKIMDVEIEEHNSTPTVDDIILGSSSNSEGERTDHGRKVKPAKTIGKGSSSDAIRDAAGRPLGKCDLNVSRNEEVREYNSAATDKMKILNSSSNPKGVGNLPKTDKQANSIVTSSSAEALRHAVGLKRREKGSDSDFGALGQAESGNSDLELLRDFVAKIARKECVKGLKIAPTDKIDALGSSVKTECKRKNPPQKVEVQQAGFAKPGRSSSTSLLEMQDQRGREAIKLQIMEDGKSQAEDIQKVEVATIAKKSILKVSLKPQKHKAKRKMESDTPQFQEPAFPSIRVVSDSSISKSKSKQKSGVSTDIVIFNESSSRKVTKRLVHSGQCESKEQCVAHDDGKSSVSGTRNKKRKRTDFPSTVKIRDSAVHMELSKLPGSKENLQIIKFYSEDDSQSKALVLYDDSQSKALAPYDDSQSMALVPYYDSQSKALVPYDDSQSKALVPLPYTDINLGKLKLIDLRAIAREQKVPKYSKLRKQALLELLVDHLRGLRYF